MVTMLSDTYATITWTEAAGDVDMYIVLYTLISEDREFNASVDGSDTTFTLTGLEPASEYHVVILTVNSDGDSAASPVTTFTTLGTFKIIIVS